jgi:hypothetical protein
MARRQLHDLLAPAVEARDNRGGMQLGEGCEGGVDLAFAAGLQDMELHPLPRAASARSWIVGSGFGLFRSTNRAIYTRKSSEEGLEQEFNGALPAAVSRKAEVWLRHLEAL